jgi:hypothetical protein
VPPDLLSPHAWLDRQPLQPSEQLFAIFSNASSADPIEAWKRLTPTRKASPIWADTAYAEWQMVMPFVAAVAVDSEFVQWVATTESRDWGWLAVSSASQEALAEHLRSLTQVLLPDGRAVFFRFWDGRHVLPVLQSAEVSPADLLPVIGRCLINGQALDIGGSAQKTSKVFPWWEVSDALLKLLGAEDPSARVNNLLQWLSEERPDIFEAFSERVLRSKVAYFIASAEVSSVSRAELLVYLEEERC